MKTFDIELGETFKKEVKKLLKKYRSLSVELVDFTQNLAENPIQGSPLGRNCYKIRLAIKSKGKGKSGGARVISCVISVEEKVVLLSIYDKEEQDTISDKRLTEILKEAELLE